MARATLSFFELPAGDPERLAAFFREVFGWEALEVPWEGPRYLRLLPPDSGEPPGGGILERGDGPRALVDRLTVMIRIEGEPLEAVLLRVAAAGGTVLLPPTPIGEFGLYARFLDPEGSSFGLWSARAADERDPN
jgi:predicted enzyme related to lactoylglutathione lyase